MDSRYALQSIRSPQTEPNPPTPTPDGESETPLRESYFLPDSLKEHVTAKELKPLLTTSQLSHRSHSGSERNTDSSTSGQYDLLSYWPGVESAGPSSHFI